MSACPLTNAAKAMMDEKIKTNAGKYLRAAIKRNRFSSLIKGSFKSSGTRTYILYLDAEFNLGNSFDGCDCISTPPLRPARSFPDDSCVTTSLTPALSPRRGNSRSPSKDCLLIIRPILSLVCSQRQGTILLLPGGECRDEGER